MALRTATAVAGADEQKRPAPTAGAGSTDHAKGAQAAGVPLAPSTPEKASVPSDHVICDNQPRRRPRGDPAPGRYRPRRRMRREALDCQARTFGIRCSRFSERSQSSSMRQVYGPGRAMRVRALHRLQSRLLYLHDDGQLHGWSAERCRQRQQKRLSRNTARGRYPAPEPSCRASREASGSFLIQTVSSGFE